MAGKDNSGPAVVRLLEFFIPQNSRGLCRSREKQLFILALGTISFLCFGSIWFLPEKSGHGGKVKVIRDTLDGHAADLLLPPPPQDLRQEENVNIVNPNIRHGVIDIPDHHAEEDKSQFKAKLELDEEIERIRQNQEKNVLAKPNYDNKDSKKSSKQPDLVNNFAKPANKADPNDAHVVDGAPKIQGGEDPDEETRKRRDHVKGVSFITIAYTRNRT